MSKRAIPARLEERKKWIGPDQFISKRTEMASLTLYCADWRAKRANPHSMFLFFVFHIVDLVSKMDLNELILLSLKENKNVLNPKPESEITSTKQISAATNLETRVVCLLTSSVLAVLV